MSVQSNSIVEVSARAFKSLRRYPDFIRASFLAWKGQIEMSGLASAQAMVGYRDEALKGKLAGVRSARLNRGYRIYYRVYHEKILIVKVEEVNLHDYKKIERLFR